VLIARALMTDPELLLLDEPAAGLDLAGREALLLWLTRLTSDGRSPSTVLVTHHVEEIPAGYTHALLLSAGHVVARGPIKVALTSENLSRCFGLPLVVGQNAGRWHARFGIGPG
jgi:iron complex transport system ATP-binding protein